MTAPVPPGDREALAEFILDAYGEAIGNDGWPEGVWLTGLAVADAILARWRLVPVEQEQEP